MVKKHSRVLKGGGMPSVLTIYYLWHNTGHPRNRADFCLPGPTEILKEHCGGTLREQFYVDLAICFSILVNSSSWLPVTYTWQIF